MRGLRPLILALLAASAVADTVVLKDGRRLVGDIKRTGSGYTVTTADGKSIAVRAQDVQSLTPADATTAPSSQPGIAQIDKLNSLRRSVESNKDVDAIVTRYERFIEQYKGKPVAAEATKDLAMWLDRKSRGLTKHNGQWLTADERLESFEKTFDQVDRARQLVRQNQFKVAEPMLQAVLADDPQNVSSLYLLGIIQLTQDKLGIAKRNFEAVNQLTADHGPTLNNLGVILWRQNQFVASLGWYDQAMTALPQNRDVLDNVAEALHALPDEQKRTAVGIRVARRFAEQDAKLAEQMRPFGLTRLGGTWVDAKKVDDAKVAERDHQAQIASLQKEFDETQAKVRAIDATITSNESNMRQIEFNCVSRDAQGRVFQVPYPQIYYNLQADNRRLAAEKGGLNDKLNGFRAKAKQLVDSGPGAPFTGAHKMIGVEGTPLIVPPLPTTAPATNP